MRKMPSQSRSKAGSRLMSVCKRAAPHAINKVGKEYSKPSAEPLATGPCSSATFQLIHATA